jgi:hypothetical protein
MEERAPETEWRLWKFLDGYGIPEGGIPSPKRQWAVKSECVEEAGVNPAKGDSSG